MHLLSIRDKALRLGGWLQGEHINESIEVHIIGENNLERVQRHLAAKKVNSDKSRALKSSAGNLTYPEYSDRVERGIQKAKQSSSLTERAEG